MGGRIWAGSVPVMVCAALKRIAPRLVPALGLANWGLSPPGYPRLPGEQRKHGRSVTGLGADPCFESGLTGPAIIRGVGVGRKTSPLSDVAKRAAAVCAPSTGGPDRRRAGGRHAAWKRGHADHAQRTSRRAGNARPGVPRFRSKARIWPGNDCNAHPPQSAGLQHGRESDPARGRNESDQRGRQRRRATVIKGM